MRALDATQVRRLLLAAEDDRLRPLFLLAFSTELGGANCSRFWFDVDFVIGGVRVVRVTPWDRRSPPLSVELAQLFPGSGEVHVEIAKCLVDRPPTRTGNGADSPREFLVSARHLEERSNV